MTQPTLPSPVPVQTWHEPDYFQSFRCIGAACEDTCCAGWGIGVDRQTYEHYQTLDHPDLGPKLRQLVTISPASTANQHATITLQDACCPLLKDDFCSVHEELGEETLGQACATFPRVVNQVNGAIERSLDLSCPEAARTALLNPKPDFFQEFAGPITLADRRMAEVAHGRQKSRQPVFFDEVRGFAISVLQNRSYTVANRMLLLGHFCAKLAELEETGTQTQTLQAIEGFQFAIASKLFDDHLGQASAEPTSQLAIVLELVIGRVSLDYTSPAYRKLYGEFMQGLKLKTDSTILELGERYTDAYFDFYAPYMEKRGHLLEHYLVSNAYKNLFPFGAGSAAEQYILMASYFAITRTLAVGLAGHYRSKFDETHIVRAIHVCARALEHCTSYPARVLEILGNKGISSPAAMAALTQDLAQPAWVYESIATLKATA